MKGNLTNKVDECGTLLTEFMPKHTGKKKQEATHGSQKRNNPTENFVIKENQKRACKVTKPKDSSGQLPPIIHILL